MTAGAQPINLNLKSGLLSRLLGDSSSPKRNSNERGGSSSSSSSSSTAAAAPSTESLKGKVSLDLSGQYHCLVAGPQEERKTQGTLIPLFGLGTVTKGWTPPSLILSIEYNFSRAWYGATRLLTNLQWLYRSDELETERSSSPFTINVKTEKGLEEPGDYAAEVGVSWKALNRNPAHLEVRWEPSCGQVSVSVPLHKSLELVWRSILVQKKPATGYFESRFPSPTEDWWIPNLMMNTAGRLTAKNEVALAVNKKRRIGIRLMVSRQLGWSAFGGAIVDDPDTLLRLEVRGMDDRAESFSAAAMETVLERVRASTRWTLSHEQVHIL
jgi:hypothetical protein